MIKTNLLNILQIVLLLWVGPAFGAVFHVKTDGTRTSGASFPGDWGPENCYATLAEVSLQYTFADTVLLFSESHVLDSAVALPTVLGNMDLAHSWDETVLQCEPGSSLLLGSSRTGSLLRGIDFRGTGGVGAGSLLVLSGGFPSDSPGLVVDSCRFFQFAGNDGNGGGSCMTTLADGGGFPISLSNCLFEENVSSGPGGALFFLGGYSVAITQSSFLNNESQPGSSGGEGRGGALACEALQSPTSIFISDSFFDLNRAWGPGGAVFVDDASLSLVRVELDRSESAVGGATSWSAGAGVFLRRTGTHGAATHLLVQDCSFSGNVGHIDLDPWAGDGGAVMVKGDLGQPVSVEIESSVFEGNFNAQGSGVYIGRYATGRVSYCRFLNNAAYLQGGGAFKGGYSPSNEGETAVFEYCEFSGNKAGVDAGGQDSLELGRGGAFSTRLYPRAEFYNCTFFNNSAHGPIQEGDAIMLPNEGGAFDSPLRQCQLVNCVFYGETGNSRQVVVREGALSLVSHCAAGPMELQTGGLEPVGPVVLSGSPFAEQDTLLPAAGSPLIDAGLDVGLTVDLNGILVPQGEGPDIGAFESHYSPAAAWDGASGSHRLFAFPNPFNPRTVIHYDLASPAPVSLGVFDLRGRLVAQLERNSKDAGVHQVVFNGLDDQGRALPSGTYFVKLSTDSHHIVQKLLLIR